jgi:hypothetical protein
MAKNVITHAGEGEMLVLFRASMDTRVLRSLLSITARECATSVVFEGWLFDVRNSRKRFRRGATARNTFDVYSQAGLVLCLRGLRTRQQDSPVDESTSDGIICTDCRRTRQR